MNSINIVSREEIIKERVENLREGEVVLELFKIAEELEIGDEMELQNLFSMQAMAYVYQPIEDKTILKIERLYTSIKNVYYVVELYLRGFYNRENYMKYEDFLHLVKNGMAKKVIEESHASFILHINRLKKIISKTRKKIPMYNSYFNETKELLKELDRDLSLCERYPNTSINLTEFYFGKYKGLCAPLKVKKRIGFLALEETVYSLYNEISIISKLEEKRVNVVCNKYIASVGGMIPFNLFEKIINNYLFAVPYSENPENLQISKVDAELLVREIKFGTLNITELVNQLIDKYSFTGYNEEYLKEYGIYTQKRIDKLKDSSYFGELFVVTPPE